MDTPHALDPDRPGTGANRLLAIVGLGIAALVVVALTLVFLLPRSEPSYPPGSPEAAFQAYLAASDAGDIEAAYAALSPRVRARWTYDAYVREADMYGSQAGGRRVYIDRVVRIGDEQATLHLTIEWMGGAGLTTSRWYERDVRIRMVSVDGTWYVDQALIGTQQAFS